MSKVSNWRVVSVDVVDEADPIMRMIIELETLQKTLKVKEDETMDEFEERKEKLVSDLNKKIQDSIYIKNMSKMFR